MLEKLKKLKVSVSWKSLILVGVCVILVLIDLVTKICEEKYAWNFDVIKGFIEVRSGSRNPGCAFSFLADADWGQTFLIVMTFFMLAALITLFLFLPERFIILKIAIAGIIAGALGNLIDRIAFREVRDFVELRMFGNMVSCNFADFWIVLSTALAIIDMLFINEWSLFPLTKKARAAQAEHKKKAEENENSGETKPGIAETEKTEADENGKENSDGGE